MTERTCEIEGCERQHEARGLCTPHYLRWKKYADPLAGGPMRRFRPRPSRQAAPCSIDGCTMPGGAGQGLCRSHRYAKDTHGDPTVKLKGGCPAGPANPLWLGDDIGYESAHARIKRHRGPAKLQTCTACGLAAQHWALIHERAMFRDAGLGLWYSTDPSDYQPMCATCHSAYDRDCLDVYR